MSAKHTPGPWRVRYRVPGDPSKGFFVEAPKINPAHGYNIEILCEDGNYPDEMREADAHLIAAAPDLLAGALDLFEKLPETAMLGARLRLAIAKAQRAG